MDTTLLLALLASVSICIYFPLDRKEARHVDWASPWDRALPLIPLFIIPYLGLFPFVGFAFVFLFFTPYAEAYFVSLTIAALAAAIFWYFFPIRVKRSPITGSSVLIWIINLMRTYNKPGNAFPSSHVYLSVITGYWLFIAFPLYAPVSVMCAALIAVSTVLVKQHYLVDVIGGLFWAATGIYLSYAVLSVFS
jgi:membrane-associated phospholipid phosphatase